MKVEIKAFVVKKTKTNKPPHRHSLEQVLPALFLRGKAGHGPHLDFDAGIELLPPHVPHALVGRSHCLIL